MPAVIIAFLRQIVMAVATAAIVTGAQELLNGTAKELVYEIKDKEGVTEQDAKDIVGNIFIDLTTNSVAILTVLKTGAGVKAAEFLGLTSKGFVKKKLVGKAATVATSLAATGGKKTILGIIPKILKIVAIPGTLIWLTSAIANIIEPGIYKPNETNALYKKLGIPFQYPVSAGALKPGPFTATSSVTFSDYAKSIETQNIIGIKNPFRNVTEAYTRENLADIVDYIYGQEVIKGKALSVKELLPKITPYLVILGKKTVAPTNAKSVETTTPTVKVFTGIVSQGVVGAGLTFTARPDDMIDSVTELRDAAANNLAPFLAALPAKVVYEVKVVSSITTKDGFKQTGTTQRIQVGSFANGIPKYKTVTNKFATLVLYVMTDKGTRTKLTTIVLGPVNSAKLTVAQNDLRELELALPKMVTTSDVEEIKKIETPTTSVVVTLTAKVEEEKRLTPEEADRMARAFNAFMDTHKNGILPQDTYEFSPDFYWEMVNGVLVKQAKASVTDTAPIVSSTTAQQTTVGANTTTLFDWYQSQGKTLPSVQVRAQLYADLGLGNASYYTGTTEQNTKLLNALKGNGSNNTPILANSGVAITTRENEGFPFPDYNEYKRGQWVMADLKFVNTSQEPVVFEIETILTSPSSKNIITPQGKLNVGANAIEYYGLNTEMIPLDAELGQWQFSARVAGRIIKTNFINIKL